MDFESILLRKSARQRGKIVTWLVICILPESVRKVLSVSFYTSYITFILPFSDRSLSLGILPMSSKSIL